MSKISLTLASLYPNHMVNISGPLMEIKLAEHSLATALANKVLPHPGGPKNRTPLLGDIPNFLNFSGCSIGNRINSCNSFLVFSNPPMSSQVTLGISTIVSLREEGLVICWACLKWSYDTDIDSKTWASISSASMSIRSIFSLMQVSAASLQSWAKSAPTYPWVSFAISSNFTS